jgi:tetratricopeptide (TPR) repeat protein
MSEVFISYRQTDDEQKQRVREFAERLRSSDVDVILDQFFLHDHPEGPHEGWDKWSSDCALQTEYVLIIGTKEWFDGFAKIQPTGTGLGAASEADDIRYRIHKANGVIEGIRVLFFDDADATAIPAKLERYHHFHAKSDFENIVRWLGGTIENDDKPRTSIPHNLPSLQPFFGREEELKKIAEALDPENRTWGALIDGPGGIGKTSLAIRAAYDAPKENFKKIVFISLKSRELDDAGVRKVGGFLISGLAEFFNELARELGHPDIAKVPENQRPAMLVFVLRDTRTLLVLDNLESLRKDECDVILTFVKRLPRDCKAILTSRVRVGSAGEELTLEQLSESAALEMLTKLAESRPAIAKTSEDEWRELYKLTGGKPLLLRWTVGQIGRGSCLTLSDAIAYLKSCPPRNNPLEFVFGYLVEDFSDAETRVLCALTYFNFPATVEHISELVGFSITDIDHALRSLANCALVVPSNQLTTFVLDPLVANFLRKKRPKIVSDVGKRLQDHVYNLAVQNGYEKHDRFPVLGAAWPIIAAALPCLLIGSNERLQEVCRALFFPCHYMGRYDELVALNTRAESRAQADGDFWNAGWRAYQAGWVLLQLRHPAKVLAAADRADAHWIKATQAGPRERAVAITLRGSGHKLANDSPAAIAALREAVELLRTLNPASADVATALNSLADAERLSGDGASAECDYREARRISLLLDNQMGVSVATGNLAELALNRSQWPNAEILSREALLVAEKIAVEQLIASHSRRLAMALLRQDKRDEAIEHAQRAVEIFKLLRLPEVAEARIVRDECIRD